MSNLADLDRDDLDWLQEQLEQRRKARGDAAARASLESQIQALSEKTLTDEEVDRIAAAVIKRSEAAPAGGDGAGADGQGAGEGGGSGDGGNGDPDPKPKKLTRQGRKSGSVYDWDVDDDGRVVPLDVAKVYNGEDEADEVEYDDPDVAA